MLTFIWSYLLDFVFGDPKWILHPVVGIGKAIEYFEKLLRKHLRDEKVGGIVLTIIILSGTVAVSYLFLKIAYFIHLGTLFAILLGYFALSIKSLRDGALRVYQALDDSDLGEARGELSHLVGRDTKNLSQKEVVRATVETVAENTVDGAVAPLFYLILGGPVLALTYKAINTLDSMVGYKNKMYVDFGWASAKLDDIANFVPARLTGLLIPAAAWLLRNRAKECWRIRWRDGEKHPSPNSAIPEAAVAGALGIQLGGMSYYQGQLSQKPFLGNSEEEISRHHIREATQLMYLTSFLMVILGVTLRLILMVI
ncbi:cobalamin biosynthesis protein CobD [bacterium]|nr:cobalamin biosynthesis protein CobD [bacterium]MCK4325960.1 cobalamin biosynthesis protein CobD [bacterium]